MKEYKLYKAKVVGIKSPSEDGTEKRQILISPLNRVGTGPWPKPATPPSWLPTSNFGSGATSYPDIGQECLVAQYLTERHIVAYTPPKDISSYGTLEPHRTPEGGVTFGVQGVEKSFITLDRQGGISLYSNMFGQMRVDGEQKSVLIKSYEHKTEFAGGHKHHFYDKEDHSTSSQEVYTRFKDNPGLTDANLGTEEPYSSPIPPTTPPYKYVDKAIISAGYNENGSLYNLETRQNINSSRTGKDTFTKLSLGYQQSHRRWGQQIEYPAGNIIELSGKRNIAGNVGTFLYRWGKWESNYGNEQLRGEIFRQQVLDGLNNGKIYGNPQTDPAGRGKGYSYGKKVRADQQMITSFGYLNSISDQEQKGSIYRRFIHRNSSSDTLWSHNLVGGDGGDLVWRKFVGKGELSLKQELSTGEDGIYKLTYDQNGEIEQISVQNKKIILKSSDDVSISIEGEEIKLKMKDSELKLTPEGLTYNDKALVFETLVDFFNTAKNNLALDSRGAPAPMHPSNQGKFSQYESKNHTSPQGFRTKK